MTLPVAEIGKPPDVAEADSESKTRKQELDRIVPAASVLVHRRVFAEVVVMEILRSVILGQAGLCLHIKRVEILHTGPFSCSTFLRQNLVWFSDNGWKGR